MADDFAAEGQRLAHRAILGRLVATQPDRAAWRDWLAEQSLPRDGQEDPGAVPSAAMALEGARCAEFRAILDSLGRAERAAVGTASGGPTTGGPPVTGGDDGRRGGTD